MVLLLLPLRPRVRGKLPTPPNANFFGTDTFNVTVTANGQSTTKNITVNVAAVDDDNPVFTNPAYNFSVNENTTAVTTVTATDPDTKTVTFTKDSSADWSYFNMVNGVISFKAAPDYENDPKLPGSYSIGVLATDADGQTASQVLTIGVLDVPENPKLSVPGALAFPFPISLDEDGNWTWTSENDLVADLNITDDDANQSQILAWSISGAPSKGTVNLSGTGAQPTTFTYIPDANATGADMFVLKVSDNTSPVPLTYEHNFSVTINPLADDPLFTHVGITTRQQYSVSNESNQSVTLDENTSTTLYITAFDADAADTLTYTISGQDSAKFDINPSTGDLTFKVGQEPDFENPQDANSDGTYELIIQVSDNDTPVLFDTLSLFINARDRNEAPFGISPTSATILENTTFIADLNASDVDYDDNNSNFVWSLDTANGNDTSKFSITTDGFLSFSSAPNYESPNDTDTNNSYNVGVRVTDSDGSFASTTFIVDVANANDSPVISLTSSLIPVAEGVQNITYFTGTDEDDPANALAWRISDGNTSLFSIDSVTGLLRFVSTSVMPDLDFNATGLGEAAVSEKRYTLDITARDSNNTEDTKQVTIKVEQANDYPIVDSSALINGVIVKSLTEDGNFTTALSSIVTDPEGLAMSYNVTGAPSNGTETLNSVSGTLTYVPNADFHGSDDLNVTVTDSAGNSVLIQVAIDVIAVNDAPSFTNYISATAVDEGFSAEIYDFNATDIDSDDNTLTFGLTGTDYNRFLINQNTGSLTFASLPDYENPGDSSGDNIYDLNVTVSDLQGAVLSLPLSISIRDVNEPPTLVGDTLFISANEEEPYTINLNTQFGTQGGSLSFTKVTAEQNGTAVLDGSTGVLVYTSNQDFNGIDYLEVNATDAGVSTTLKVAVTIFSVNDPPIITDKSSLSSQTQQLNENISNIIDLNVTDPNDSPASVNFSWSLSAKDSNVSHTDWNYFTINPSTGELSFTSPPNYEVDNSILGTNIYEFVASVSDNQGGVETDSVSLRVQVMPVNESPSFSKSIEVLTTLEDASVDGNLSAYFSDPDAGTSPQFVIASNPGSGTIQSFNAAEGSFSYVPNANFAGSDTFDVNATDGVNTPVVIRVDVTVTSVNDAPAITVDYTTPIPVVENLSTVWDLSVTDAPDNNVATSYFWSIGPLDGNTSHSDYVYFTIDDSNGTVSFISPPDFDADNSVAKNNIYEFSVTVSDLGGTANGGAQSHTVNLKVRVTDGDESPILYVDQLRSSTTNSLIVSYAINEDTSFTDSNFSQYAVDPEGQSLTWTVAPRVGTLGTPAIGAANGILSYTPLSHSNDNDVFDINVSDPSGNVVQITVDVVINPVGDNPYFVWPVGKTVNDFYTIEVQEGMTEVLDFNASDSYDFKGDYNASTANYYWSINSKDGNVSHTDVNYFNINAASGVVSFKSPADMEDNGSINSGYYEFDVVVADKDVNSSIHPVLVRVVPVNEAPIMSKIGTFSMEFSEDNASSFTLTATDPENDPIFWSTSGASNGTALYYPSTNQLTYTPNLNFTGVDTFDVNASDGSLSSTLLVTVNVLPVNDPPALTTTQIGPISFAENSVAAVYNFSATDVESDNSLLSLSLSGPDASLFYVSKTSTGPGDCNGSLHFFHPPDFETKRDVGSDGYYNVNIVIKDEGGPNFEATGEIPVLVYVTDQQEAPIFDYSVYPQSFPIAFAEDNSSSFTLQVRDPDSKSGLTWSIPALSEHNATLSSSTSEPSLGLAQATISYSPVAHFVGDDNASITVTDADGQTVQYNFTFRVSPSNDQPLFSYNPMDGVILVAENNATVFDFDANDSYDALNVTSGFFWKIMGGVDQAKFKIAADGVLSFLNTPDYEIPADSDSDNQYQVQIGVSDDDLTFRTQSLLVKVQPANDAPSFTSFDGNGSYAIMVNENINLSSQFVVAATDVESDGISFSLVGVSPQNDNSLFTINATTGAVSFSDTNYENFEGNTSKDLTQDNDYLVEVNASDNGIPSMSTIQMFSLKIADADEAPVFGSLSPNTISENQDGVFFTPQVDHADAGQTLRFELVESNDYLAFELNSTLTGAFRFKSVPNYENPLDAEKDNQYKVTMRVYDSNLTTAVPAEKTFSITVNGLNEAPSFTNPNPTFWFNYRHPEGDKKVIVLEDYLLDVDGGTGLDDLIASGQSGIMVENDLSGSAFSSVFLKPGSKL
ncbi:MAG: tandem-95 repeat protein [Opitutales bacterium]